MSSQKMLGRGLAAGLVILILGGLGLGVLHLPLNAQHDLHGVWAYVANVATALGAVLSLLTGIAKLFTPAPAPAVDKQLSLLAQKSKEQWEQAVDERGLRHPGPLPIRWRLSTAAVAGSAPVATYPWFDPLPGLNPVSDSDLGEGDLVALYRVFGGLPSGRLLLVGEPGSGKSTAAILLLIDILKYRERATRDDQAKIPVPVLVTLAGWNPSNGQSVTDWLVDKLAETYSMFHSGADRCAAKELLDNGRLAVFLDGLDEVPESLRPAVLQALASARFRLILLTRTDEAVAAAQHAHLADALALELQPVHPTAAAVYLLQPLIDPPPAPWQTISDHLGAVADDNRRTSTVSRALNTPLTLSLLRDVYGPTGPVDELLDESRFSTAADIERHLLDHAIAAAYTPRPGQPTPRYSVATAQRTLCYLATQLTEHRTRDLAWWHIPTWTPHRARMVTVGVVTVLSNMLIYGLGLGLVFGPALALSVGFISGIINFVTGLAGNWQEVAIMPRRITRLTPRSAIHNLVFGLVSGLGGGLLAGVPTGFLFGLPAGFGVGLPVGLSFALVAVVARGSVTYTDIEEGPIAPVDVWRYDTNAGLVLVPVAVLVLYFLAILANILVPGLASALESRLSVVLPIGLLIGLLVGLLAASMAKRQGTAVSSPGASALDTSLALARLAIQRKTPLRLILFLEDARRRHLLRTVGPVYQFRHATLQDRLAQPTPEQSSQPQTTPPPKTPN